LDRCDEVKAMWEAYLATLPPGAEPRPYMTWHFASSEPVADELGRLAAAGIKTATAGLLWDYEANEEEVPRPGDLSIITDWSGAPLCIAETTEVVVRPFSEVDERQAYDEGEGDRTLAYWREVHWRVFSDTCAGLGREPSPDMPVVCEHFRLVFPPHRVR
jgi:uncharacterized protein YhfF